MSAFKSGGPTLGKSAPPTGDGRELMKLNLRRAFDLPEKGCFADLLDAISESDQTRRR